MTVTDAHWSDLVAAPRARVTAEIADWLIAQPWSSGRVGSLDIGETQSPTPQHSFRRADGSDFGAREVVAVELDLLPIAYQWKRGHRIRLALATADLEALRETVPAFTCGQRRRRCST